jgi:hypothetical protein
MNGGCFAKSWLFLPPKRTSVSDFFVSLVVRGGVCGGVCGGVGGVAQNQPT